MGNFYNMYLSFIVVCDSIGDISPFFPSQWPLDQTLREQEVTDSNRNPNARTNRALDSNFTEFVIGHTGSTPQNHPQEKKRKRTQSWIHTQNYALRGVRSTNRKLRHLNWHTGSSTPEPFVTLDIRRPGIESTHRLCIERRAFQEPEIASPEVAYRKAPPRRVSSHWRHQEAEELPARHFRFLQFPVLGTQTSQCITCVWIQCWVSWRCQCDEICRGWSFRYVAFRLCNIRLLERTLVSGHGRAAVLVGDRWMSSVHLLSFFFL